MQFIRTPFTVLYIFWEIFSISRYKLLLAANCLIMLHSIQKPWITLRRQIRHIDVLVLVLSTLCYSYYFHSYTCLPPTTEKQQQKVLGLRYVTTDGQNGPLLAFLRRQSELWLLFHKERISGYLAIKFNAVHGWHVCKTQAKKNSNWNYCLRRCNKWKIY